ncbi:MAG: hypothetical protein K0S32_1953 [Bacteroidetes bacterium]|jgi:hypothetical protein|nr:hypothetical protein [Bacteroidota bacterium]
MKKLLFACTIVLTLSATAQKGKAFPSIIGKTLDEKAVNLPIKNNKQTIVAIAFHRGAEDELKKWLNPLYYTFMKKEKGKSNFDVSEIYDVNFVFVPMISGFKKIADDFKSGTQKEFWPYIMDTEKSDIKGVQKALGITDSKIPYFFVVDKDGKILEVQSGDYSEAKVDALEEAVGE